MNPTQTLAATLLLSLSLGLGAAAPAGSSFTYQGRLADNGAPATGLYDLQAVLFDDAAAGAPLGTNIFQGLFASNGLYLATLDFGSAAFNGDARWLELSVRTNGAAAWTLLSPRQSLTAAPYALRAAAAGALTAPVPDTQLSANIPRLDASNTFTGAVAFNGPFAVAGVVKATSFQGDGSALGGIAKFNPSPSQGPPFSVGSNSLLVTNLNADLLDGQHASAFSLTNHTHSAADIVSGTLANARLSGNYSNVLAFTNAANNFAGNFSGGFNGGFTGTFTGNGGALTNLIFTLVGPASGDLSGNYPAPVIANNAVTAAKIATGQVVKSLNALHDNVVLAAGTNVALTTNGNTLQFAVPSASLGALGIKSGLVSGIVGSDTFYRTNIVFGTPYATTNYAISVTAMIFQSGTLTTWIEGNYTNKQTTGFTLILSGGAATKMVQGDWITVLSNNN
jgi:hypothetical protein